MSPSVRITTSKVLPCSHHTHHPTNINNLHPLIHNLNATKDLPKSTIFFKKTHIHHTMCNRSIESIAQWLNYISNARVRNPGRSVIHMSHRLTTLEASAFPKKNSSFHKLNTVLFNPVKSY